MSHTFRNLSTEVLKAEFNAIPGESSHSAETTAPVGTVPHIVPTVE